MKLIVVRAARGCETGRAQVTPQGDPHAWKAQSGCKSISQMNAACWRPPQRPVILAHFVPRGDDLALAYFSTPHLALSPPQGTWSV